MRIDSTDATAVRTGDISPGAEKKVEIKTTTGTNKSPTEENIAGMSEYERRELPVGEKVLIEAVEKANKAISMSGRTFEYKIHEKTKEIMIKVIDSDTKQVIREIPPEKTLDMVAKMMEMAGLLVDERR
jgi:flagellar protein FlaG